MRAFLEGIENIKRAIIWLSVELQSDLLGSVS